MSDRVEQNKNLQSKLSDKYRVVFYDDDTLGEVRSGKVSLAGILIGLCLYL